MDRFWFLTSTTYGTWLPGDDRGSVTTVWNAPGPRKRHNIPGTPCDESMPGLQASARAALKEAPIYFTRAQAEALLAQFQETAEYRGWLLLAVAIMANHCHILVGVRGDPEPDVILGNFKSYGSRALNRHWGKPACGTWWTEGGSKRKKVGKDAVHDAIQYTRGQEHPLVIWVNPGVETSSWPWSEWQPLGERGASAP
jgi:REP element-mobilizing transposase RayT